MGATLSHNTCSFLFQTELKSYQVPYFVLLESLKGRILFTHLVFHLVEDSEQSALGAVYLEARRQRIMKGKGYIWADSTLLQPVNILCLLSCFLA